MDQTEDGRRLKMMPIVDEEYTRECLNLEVERSITAEEVVTTLARLFRQRGEPSFIRSDNGVPSSSPLRSKDGSTSPRLGLSTSSRQAPGRTLTRRHS
jgi:hypothetical protein